MDEQLIAWKPLKGTFFEYKLLSISSTVEHGFVITLQDLLNHKKILTVTLQSPPDAWQKLPHNKALDSYQSAFFKVKNSKYLSQCITESIETRDTQDYKHYAFIVENFIINMLCTEEPKLVLS